MNLTIKCRICKKDQNIIVDEVNYRKWKATRDAGLPGNHIQNVLPELTPDEREMLITQTCGTCFDDLFKEDEE
jgi:hypothetical protein